MLTQQINDALNEQITREMHSSLIYLSMAAYFTDTGLKGFAHWMRVQAEEEMFHAMKVFDFIHDRNGRVKLSQIAEPTHHWDSVQAVMEHTLAHEEGMTRSINELVDLAIKERDHATHNFLSWFVQEQVEEEDTLRTILDKLRLVGNRGEGMFMLDQEMSARTISTPLSIAGSTK